MFSTSPKVSDNDAWALLSLRSAPTSPMRIAAWSPDEPKGIPLARLEGRDFEYTMRLPQRRVTVGRSSSKGEVDINMEHSSFVSRNHLQIYCSTENGNRFFLTCSGKNGIFVDGIFQRKGGDPMELPKSCVLRFPSTTLKISFQALVENEIAPPPPPPTILPPKYTKPSMQPLHINIPPPPAPRPSDVPSFISPCPSPTGTISAANSCPTSPRSNGTRTTLALDLPSAAAAAAFARKQSTEEMMKEPLSCGITAAEEETTTITSGGGSGEKSKPPYSYAQLIVQAISSNADRQLTLSGIYGYISKHYPYYRASDKGWQNSIRHNLSLNRFFVKVPRSQEEPGKGSFWRIDPGSEAKLIEQAFRRRRQRVSCFRSPAEDISSRSAPVSPNHYDSNFTPEGNPQSAGLIPETYNEGSCESGKSNDKQHTQPVVVPSASQRLLQLTNDLRFIQSAPVSPQGGPGQQSAQLMTMANPVSVSAGVNVSRAVPAGVTFHPLSALTAKQGIYLLQQTALAGGGAATLSTTAVVSTSNSNVMSAAKETDKPAMMLVKPVGNGSMLPGDSSGQQQQPPQQPRPDAASLFGQLPITLIQPGASSQSNDIIQKLLQQGAMVVGRLPEDSSQQQQQPAIYSLPPAAAAAMMQSSGLQPFHFVLGSQLLKQTDSTVTAASAATMDHGKVQPQIVVLPGPHGTNSLQVPGIKNEILSPAKCNPLSSSQVVVAPLLSQNSGIKEEPLTSNEMQRILQNMKMKSDVGSLREGGSSFVSKHEWKTEEKKTDKENGFADSTAGTGTVAAGLTAAASFTDNKSIVVSNQSEQNNHFGSSANSSSTGVKVENAKTDKRPAEGATGVHSLDADKDFKRFKAECDQ